MLTIFPCFIRRDAVIFLLILLAWIPSIANSTIGTVTMPFSGTISSAVYDPTGQIVRTLFMSEPKTAGRVLLEWDGKDNFGYVVPNGKYSWRAIVTQAVGVDEGSVGEGSIPTYGPGEFSHWVNGVALDDTNNLYCISYWEETHHDLRRWNADGTPGWSKNFLGGQTLTTDNTYIYTARDASGENRIDRCFAIDGINAPWTGSPSGYIVANATGGNGVFGLAVDTTLLWVSNDKQDRIELYNKATGAMQSTFAVTNPKGIVADGMGNVWVSHSGTMVTKFSPTGATLATIPNLNHPFALDFGGPSNHLFIAEVGTGRVLEYDVTTLQQTRALFSAAQPGAISATKLYWRANMASCGIAVDATGRITVTDPYNYRIQRYNADGSFWQSQFSDFVAAPFVDPTVNPNMLLSTWIQYAVDYTPGANYGKWYPAYNWLPSDTQYYSNQSVRRKLSNGKDYLYYFTVANGVVIYLIDNNTFRRCAIIGADSSLFNWTDTDGDGAVEENEKSTAPGTANYQQLSPGTWIDKQGNFWIANWNGETVKVPLDGFDAQHNPKYDWNHRVTIAQADASRWGFSSTNIKVDPGSGEIFLLGTTSYNRDCYFWMGGTAIDRRAPDGTRISVYPMPPIPANHFSDDVCVVTTDTDGKYFYTGHSYDDQLFVRMFTRDGLQVCKSTVGAPNGNAACWLDHGCSLTAFTHPINNTHYIYAAENYHGKSIRWRIDALDTTQSSNSAFTWASSPGQKVTVTASDATATEAGITPGTFMISRDSVYGPLTVNYTVTGSAMPEDYSPTLNGSVTFADRVASQLINITPVDDTSKELLETVKITLTPDAAYTVGMANQAEVTIIDNDVSVSVTATDSSASETGPDPGTYTITRDNTDGDLLVKYNIGKPPAMITAANASSWYNAGLAQAMTCDKSLTTHWMSAGNSDNEGHDDAPEITFVFDQVYTLDHLRVSNFNGGSADRGVKDMEVFVSKDGINFSSIGMRHLLRGAYNSADAYFQTLPLDGVEAKFVKFDIKTNWWGRTFDEKISYEGAWANVSIVGLAEVAFYQPGASASDFTGGGTTVTIPNGQSSATVTITPADDTLAEGPERATLALTIDPAYQIGQPDHADVTIADNEAPLQVVSMQTTDAIAMEQGQNPGAFTISRDTLAGEITVKYTLANVPVIVTAAGASSSYNENASPLKAADDDIMTPWMNGGNATNQYETAHDNNPYITFTFAQVRRIGRLRISNYNASNLTERGAKEVEVLVSTDGENFTSLGIKKLSIGSTSGENAYFQDIELGGVLAKRVMIDVKTNWHGWVFDQATAPETWANASITGLGEAQFFEGGTANSEDFIEVFTGTVTIPDGQSSVVLPITPTDDTLHEPDETVIFTLLKGAGYNLGTQKSGTVTIQDND